MTRLIFDRWGFGLNLWIWKKVTGENLPYHYEVPFFFMIKFKSWVPFSFGVVKKIQGKKAEYIFQLLHYRIFQKKCYTI